jgi:hypothetical protein
VVKRKFTAVNIVRSFCHAVIGNYLEARICVTCPACQTPSILQARPVKGPAGRGHRHPAACLRLSYKMTYFAAVEIHAPLQCSLPVSIAACLYPAAGGCLAGGRPWPLFFKPAFSFFPPVSNPFCGLTQIQNFLASVLKLILVQNFTKGIKTSDPHCGISTSWAFCFVFPLRSLDWNALLVDLCKECQEVFGGGMKKRLGCSVR